MVLRPARSSCFSNLGIRDRRLLPAQLKQGIDGGRPAVLTLTLVRARRVLCVPSVLDVLVFCCHAVPPYCTCSFVVKNRTSGQSSPVLFKCQAFLARKTGEPLWSSAMVPLFEITNFLRRLWSPASIQRAV